MKSCCYHGGNILNHSHNSTTSKTNKKEEEISVKVKIPNQEVRKWVDENYDKMGQILGNFIVDIYKANKIIKE